MLIRNAREEDAAAACDVLRRSITELCRKDHLGDPATLGAWLANKTPQNVRAWVSEPDSHVLVAVDGEEMLGVAQLRAPSRIALNYVSPVARFRGVSKAMVAALEARAAALGATRCTLESTSTARGFYLALGYRETGPPHPGFGVSLAYPMTKTIGS